MSAPDFRQLSRDQITALQWSLQHARGRGHAVTPVTLDELDALLSIAERCTCQPIRPAIEAETA